MNFKTRLATLTDITFIQKLNQLLFEKEEREFNLGLNMTWAISKLGQNYFKGLIEKEDGFLVVAEHDNKIIGYLAGILLEKHPCYMANKRAELENMLVLKEYRDLGIGSSLVKNFKEWCKEKCVEEIKVTASAFNTEGINFYKRNGFKEYDVVLKAEL